jgi:hypothetical protein
VQLHLLAGRMDVAAHGDAGTMSGSDACVDVAVRADVSPGDVSAAAGMAFRVAAFGKTGCDRTEQESGCRYGGNNELHGILLCVVKRRRTSATASRSIELRQRQGLSLKLRANSPEDERLFNGLARNYFAGITRTGFPSSQARMSSTIWP